MSFYDIIQALLRWLKNSSAFSAKMAQLYNSVYIQVLTKMICYKVRRIWDAKLIDIYILTFVIAVSAEFSVGLLLLFHLKQYLFELRH